MYHVLVEAGLVVLAPRHDTEGARRLVGHRRDPLRVPDHLADTVARVPHEALGAQLLAISDRNDAFALRVPIEIDWGKELNCTEAQRPRHQQAAYKQDTY